jgi:hypothetical protein
MAGMQTIRARGRRFAVALFVALMAFTGQTYAQVDLPPLPPTSAPAASFAERDDSEAAPVMVQAPMAVPGRPYYPGVGMAPIAPWVEEGYFSAAVHSIIGHPDPDSWRPLPFWTLFTEGWNEAWVPSPNGSGGAPRQGWINAMDGNMYRLWFFTFTEAFRQPASNNGYLGAYTLYTPLSRRLLLITNVPFVLRNTALSGLPIIGPSGQVGTATTTRNQTGFGDISFTPRILVHETQDFSLTAELAVLTPTGTQPLAGKTALTPAVSFWTSLPACVVVRGGLGVFIPTCNGGGDTAMISQLAIGQTVTPHDVPLFGDFTYYLSAVVNSPLAQGQHTSATLTPGMRTHLGYDWYFLAGLPIPVTNQRVADLGMIFWFMKAW